MQVPFASIPAKMLFLTFAGLFCLFGAEVAKAQTQAQAQAQAQSQAGPQGWWLDQTGRAGILIAPCGAKLCGNIEWLKTPLDAQGRPKTDTHNPDATLQSRLLCGLPIVWDFGPDGSGGWTGGEVYDPETGKTYTSVMHLQPDGTLKVRGYIGIPLLGRSAIWTRPSGPLPQCKGAG